MKASARARKPDQNAPGDLPGAGAIKEKVHDGTTRRPAHARRRQPLLTELWEAHRRRMLDLPLRMLSDLPDAEDVVQEAFSRLARAEVSAIGDPEGWLVVVTSRLCLDRLRTRGVTRPRSSTSPRTEPTRTHPTRQARSRWLTTSPWPCIPSSSA